MTASLSRCVRCGSDEIEDRQVEKLVRGGDDVVALRVPATVCHHCGERYFPADAIRVLDEARRDLAEGRVSRFRPLGRLLAPRPDGAR